ncbi:FG-GAP-like repeat-containing protein [Phaeobacter sp. PT47_59]|uniref:FG-GAP-like repeat-containing protein n=1 Tax=Phaeobacter sp. PT47_59 TaxID=3029979 RepID=UPI002380812B|nr:FG-GAP-like repeat-containing protein [Phaeobacter sp. PT47_59]MDE4175209.1 FG-GAP-like repeat-containing protein [Phaeobacter sp. PT47_59]
MTQIATPFRNTRLILSLLIVGVLAYLFWTGSRYPALNEKAMMSGAIQLEDPLSFEAKYQLTEAMGLVERIFYSTLNWINTNKKGMTFGILFAAALMTALSYLQKRSFSGAFANSALGLAIGAPLGVCANCVAPIGKGLYASGMRAETTLSAMVASPTLNIVVLSMLFSLLPFYMAVAKLALSLVVILVAVPLLCRLLPQTQLPAPDVTAPAPTPWSSRELGQQKRDSLPAAVLDVAWSYLKNLWYVIKLTVPMMLLAGFLGAIVGTLFPQDLVTGLGFGIAALMALTLVALFLPVPMGFDVVLCGALIAAGLAHGYVMAALFTLGSFSIYSFMIITQTLGLRAAALMAALIGSLGFAAGIGAHAYHDWQSRRALEMLLGETSPAPTPPAPAFWGAAHAATLEGITVSGADADRITVTATPFAPPSPANDALFTRLEARELGIDKPVEFTMRDMWPPFWEGRSLSSGDIDRDGDIDLAVASTEVGLYLYANDGRGQFSRMPVDLGALSDAPIFNAALADIDNDGWPDLFLTTYLQGNYWWRNVNGAFGAEPPRPVPNTPETPLTMALSFADLDGDSHLDVALGNWAAGWYRRIPGEESRNRVILNTDGQLSGAQHQDLPGIPGETLSILFSDFDGDGHSDLIVGNDFDIPDYFYRGTGTGALTMVTQPEGVIPHTTTTTMAVKVADLFNDARPEIYLAQIAGRSSGVSSRLKMQPLSKYCAGIVDAEARATCETNMAIKQWYKAGNSFDPTYAGRCQQMQGRYGAECKAMLIKDLAIQKRDASVCTLIPASQPIPRAYCDLHFKPARSPRADEIALSHPQILRSNVLLERQADGAFADTATAHGLEVGGWSWDTKVADFDQDGWQDIYIVNGTWVPNEVSPSNLFFHNDGGTGDGSLSFTEASGEFGLEDYLMTAAATRFDMDGDGDLDLVTHPVNGPMVVFRNSAQGRAGGGQALMVALEDHIGNRDGIGARLVLELADGSQQMREIQLGGGFMSFDAPQAHFGLGAAAQATALRILWPGGGESQVEGPLEAGRLYRILRAQSSGE